MASPYALLASGLALLLAQLLQGCGGDPKNWSSYTVTDDEDASAGLRRCPESMLQRLTELATEHATQQRYAVGLGYIGPSLTDDEVCVMGVSVLAPSRQEDQKRGRDAFPMGSFTKTWTASAVLKLHEEGVLDIDEPAFPRMEFVYQKAMGRSLLSRFGPGIQNVTARQLMSMRGSLKDFNEIYYQQEHPLEDMGPGELVQMYGASTGMPVGTCGSYSSMSYTILGLLLVNASGAKSWDSYNQNVWEDRFPRVNFGVHGPCGSYTDVQGHRGGTDPLAMSCTGGFTCGNMIAHPVDAARFLYELLEGRLLKPDTVKDMQAFQPFGKDGATAPGCAVSWGEGHLYGLGLFGSCPRMPGHSGVTYGYLSQTQYDTEARAAISVSVASSKAVQQRELLLQQVHEAFLKRWPLPREQRAACGFTQISQRVDVVQV